MNLLIVGASVRAHVQSAIAAGHCVRAYDLFADWDTQAACARAIESGQWATIDRIDSFAQLIDIAARGRACADRSSGKNRFDRAIVCGGVENHVNVMDAVAAWVPLAGCDHPTIAAANDWEKLTAVFHDAGCQIAITTDRLPSTAIAQQWLRKPVTGSGGIAIRVAEDSDRDTQSATRSGQYCFQKWISGDSFSALFVANGRGAMLVGITLQLVGDQRFTDHPFAYCGSIGPVTITEQETSIVTKLGHRLTSAFHINGVFGVDFIRHAGGVYPVDINLRIPASAELFEHADSTPTNFGTARRAMDRPQPFNAIDAQLGRWAGPIPDRGQITRSFGKAIVFNQHNHPLTVDHRIFDQLSSTKEVAWGLADIPKIGTRISSGEPIVTIRASGTTQAAVQTRLVSLANQARCCWSEPADESGPTTTGDAAKS